MTASSVARSLRHAMEGRRGHAVVFLDDGLGCCIHHECDFVAAGRSDADEYERTMKGAETGRKRPARASRRLGGWIGG